MIGIDREIQPHIREALCRHPLAPRISLLEGDSTDPQVVSQVRSLIGSAGPVLVILDSDHTREHVARELECYAPLVTKGSYIVATDGIMKDLSDVPRAHAGLEDRQSFRGGERLCGAPSGVPPAAAALALARRPTHGKRYVLAGSWLQRVK